MIWPLWLYKMHVVYTIETCPVKKLSLFSFNKWWFQDADCNDFLVRRRARIWTQVWVHLNTLSPWNQRRGNNAFQKELREWNGETGGLWEKQILPTVYASMFINLCCCCCSITKSLCPCKTLFLGPDLSLAFDSPVLAFILTTSQ